MTLTTTTEEVSARVPLTVLTLEGELDASNFERLIDEVRTLYDNGTRNLLIDLGGLTFLASSGLVALHSIVRLLHGEPPPDLESGWDALHSLGLDVSSGASQTACKVRRNGQASAAPTARAATPWSSRIGQVNAVPG